jgi:hypothetical protein
MSPKAHEEIKDLGDPRLIWPPLMEEKLTEIDASFFIPNKTRAELNYLYKVARKMKISIELRNAKKGTGESAVHGVRVVRVKPSKASL